MFPLSDNGRTEINRRADRTGSNAPKMETGAFESDIHIIHKWLPVHSFFLSVSSLALLRWCCLMFAICSTWYLKMSTRLLFNESSREKSIRALDTEKDLVTRHDLMNVMKKSMFQVKFDFVKLSYKLHIVPR